MAVLSDGDIILAIDSGDLKVRPYDITKVRSNHLDLKLGNTFRVAGPNRYRRVSCVDTYREPDEELFDTVRVEDGTAFTMEPGDFAIVTTKEWLAFDGEFMGILTGRSSIGRLGVQVHSTAAHFDRGFRGYPNLEMSLVAPWSVMLYPGMGIASMIFHQLSSPCLVPYGGQLSAKYQDQGIDPTPSKIYLDRINKKVD